jgi:N-acetylmuramoyl-L-alanine amidase
VVAEADALAVDAAKAGGATGAKLFVQAAALRARIWRAEGSSADALEAEELYRSAARTSWAGTCDAEVDLAFFDGELKSDPGGEYRALYAARARHRGEPCKARIEPALATLAAFAPPPDALAELDRGKPTAPSESAEAPGAAVVLPDLSEIHSTEPARITNIERYDGKDASRVVVFVTRPTLFEVGELAADGSHGPRLFIDIKNSKYGGRKEYPGGGLVEGVRVGTRGDGTRVVIDLSESAYRRIFYLPEPFRLVVDLSRQSPVSAAAEGGPRHVRRIVIDPGHGGHDPGALGPDGLREKDVVLDIAHRAAPLVARELGIATLLTRDNDVFVPLDERVARANAFSADLFVSVHCNASESPSGKGVMTFVLDASRDDLAMRVAARENAASEEASVELANVMSHVIDRRSLAQSNHFAELLQRSAVASLAPRYPEIVDQGVKAAGFYVLAGARMPAVLFETSFISNPAEERRLDTGDYRQKMADALVNAVRAFRDGL